MRLGTDMRSSGTGLGKWRQEAADRVSVSPVMKSRMDDRTEGKCHARAYVAIRKDHR